MRRSNRTELPDMADPSIIKRLAGRLRQYPVAIAASVVALVIALLVFARSSHLEQLEQQLQERELEWSRVSGNLKRARDLEGHLEQIIAADSAVTARLMDPEEVAINYDYFYQLERASGVRLTTLNQGGVIETKGSNIPGIAEFKEYQLIGYTIALEGGFTNVVSFLSRLQTGEHFVRVSAFTVNRARQGGSGDAISANLQVQILGISDES